MYGYFLRTKVVFPVFWPFSGKTVITVIVLKLKKAKQNIALYYPYNQSGQI